MKICWSTTVTARPRRAERTGSSTRKARRWPHCGHEVIRFERYSDEIEQLADGQKATLPARVVWNRETRRDLTATLREHRPDVVHVHNTFPLLSAAVLYACRDARGPGRGHHPQLQAGLRQRRLLPGGRGLPRLRGRACPCPRCPARLLPGLAGRHRAGGPGHERAPAGLAVAGVGLHLHLGLAARPARPGWACRRTGSSSGTTSSPAATVPQPAPEPTVVYAGRLDEAKGAAAADGRLGPLPRRQSPDRGCAWSSPDRGPLEDEVAALGGGPAVGRAGRPARAAIGAPS